MSESRFAPKEPGQGYPGASRDWFMGEIPCTVSKCPANNGQGKCVMPSCITIGGDGVCEMAKKFGKAGG